MLTRAILPTTHSTAVETRRYQALDRWTSQLNSLHTQLLSKSAQVGPDRGLGAGAGGGGGSGGGIAGTGIPWAGSGAGGRGGELFASA